MAVPIPVRFKRIMELAMTMAQRNVIAGTNYLRTVLLCMWILTAPLCASANPVITIKFSHVAAVGTPKSDAAELFK